MDNNDRNPADFNSSIRWLSKSVVRNWMIMRKRWEIAAAERKRRNEISRLGNQAYRLCCDNRLSAEELESQIRKVAAIDQEIKTLEENLRDILLKVESSGRQEEAPVDCKQIPADPVDPDARAPAIQSPPEPVVPSLSPTPAKTPAGASVKPPAESSEKPPVEPAVKPPAVAPSAAVAESVDATTAIPKPEAAAASKSDPAKKGGPGAGAKNGGAAGRQDTKKVAKLISGAYSDAPSVKTGGKPGAKAPVKKTAPAAKPAVQEAKKPREPGKK